MKQNINIGILGLGTVAGGTIDVLSKNIDDIGRRTGKKIVVTHATARDINKTRSFSTDNITLVDDAMEIINNAEIDIICELIGGTDVARELVLASIAQGKHVVTANKALIAIHGDEIFAAANAKGVMVAYEASVAGGIPIIKALREGLSANQIELIAGIINGTSNYILTEISEHGRDFNEVLQDAQALGYAEADPTFDVEGVDAAHKLTILASIAFGMPLQYNKVYTEGITHISPEDTKDARELGYCIKHLGIAKRKENGIELRVHPALIPERRLIANVNGVKNAVLINSDAAENTIYYGPGAGALPTASAVVADIIDISRAIDAAKEHQLPALGFTHDALQDLAILSMDEVETAYFLRLQAQDRPGVLADVTRIFGDHAISIESIIQKEPPEHMKYASVVILTQVVKEKNMNTALEQIEQLESINGKVTRIRVEALD